MDASFQHRLVIWDVALELIGARPMLGYGFKMSYAAFELMPPVMLHGNVAPAVHSHTMFTEILLHLGIVGVAFFVVLVAYILRRIYDVPPSVLPYALAGFSACFIFEHIGANFWHSWLASSMFLSVYLFVMLTREVRGRDSASNPPGSIGA